MMTPSSCSRRFYIIFGLVIVIAGTTQGQGQSSWPQWSNNENNSCRKGLCPYVKKLVPNLHTHPAMSHYNPVIHGGDPPSLCGNMCTSDLQCPHHQKCCPTHCGYACFDTIFAADSVYHSHHEHHETIHQHHNPHHHESNHHHNSHHHESNHHHHLEVEHHDSHHHKNTS